MKRKLLILGIALIVIINLSAFGTLSYKRWCRYRAECRYINHQDENYLYTQLSLSESQIEEMKTIKQSFFLRTDRINTVLHGKRIKLVDLLTASQPDKEKIDKVLEEVDSLQAELQKDVIYNILKEKVILTPVQQEKFFSIIKERLIRESRHLPLNGFDLLEDNCNVKCENYK